MLQHYVGPGPRASALQRVAVALAIHGQICPGDVLAHLPQRRVPRGCRKDPLQYLPGTRASAWARPLQQLLPATNAAGDERGQAALTLPHSWLVLDC